MSFDNVVAVVLAAGAARRFGRPKQLEHWPGPNSPTLVERAVGLTLEAGIKKVYVVVGNQQEKVIDVLANSLCKEAIPVYNSRWEEGQGFSVAAGVQAVRANEPQAEAILFTLADQPRLQATTLITLLKTFSELKSRGEETIFFPTYGGKRGNPVIFGRAFFDKLAGLEGDVGGRSVVKQHLTAVLEVPVDDPAIHEDVDRLEDLEKLKPL